MTHSDQALQETLDRLVPRREETVEWDDVLERAAREATSSWRATRLRSRSARGVRWAGVEGRTHSKRRRYATRALVLAAVVAALAALAVPASGVVDTLRGFFQGAPPTPAVEQHVAKWNELAARLPSSALQRLPSIDESRVHGVLTLIASPYQLYLWAGPASDGWECWLISIVDNRKPPDEQATQTVYGRSGCRAVGLDKAGTSWFGAHEPGNTAGIAWSEFPNAALPGLRIVFGRVWDDVQSARITVDGGDTLDVPVVEHYFLALIGPDSTTSRITVFDERGNQVSESAHGSVAPVD